MKTTGVQQPSFTAHVLGVELQKAEKLIEDFVYSCSHGLRSPLRSIAGMVLLLRNCSSESVADQKLYLRFLSDSVHKVQGILNQFEQFIENSRQEQVVERVDFNAFCVRLADNFCDQLDMEHIEVSIHVNQKCAFCTDKNRLNIILSRLFSNAVVFQDPSKAAKKIEFFVTASRTGCSIQIRDNGLGIGEPEMAKIFDLFFRGSEKSNGAGIGLYIVKEVIAKMDGTIAVHSKPKEGSTFSVWLPNLCR